MSYLNTRLPYADETNPRRFSCYILECAEGKYYAGSTLTRNVQNRFQMHCNGTGAKWCRAFPPLRIIKVTDNLTSQEAFDMEDSECVRIMRENNDIQICRGGNYNFPPESTWWYQKVGPEAWIATH